MSKAHNTRRIIALGLFSCAINPFNLNQSHTLMAWLRSSFSKFTPSWYLCKFGQFDDCDPINVYHSIESDSVFYSENLISRLSAIHRTRILTDSLKHNFENYPTGFLLV